MVVAVLMNKEWLSDHPKNGPAAAHRTIDTQAIAKASGRPAARATTDEMRSKPSHMPVLRLRHGYRSLEGSGWLAGGRLPGSAPAAPKVWLTKRSVFRVWLRDALWV